MRVPEPVQAYAEVETTEAIAAVEKALALANPSDPLIAALRAVLGLRAPGSFRVTESTPAPPRSRLISAAEAAQACGLTKEAMVKRLRRLGIGQKVVGRWYVDRETLIVSCPEFRDLPA